jgi:hypothetical protein
MVLYRMRYVEDYKDYQTARYGLVREQKGESAEVPEYSVIRRRSSWDVPITVNSDITEDSRNWQNVCFANYFGLKDVRIRKRGN